MNLTPFLTDLSCQEPSDRIKASVRALVRAMVLDTRHQSLGERHFLALQALPILLFWEN